MNGTQRKGLILVLLLGGLACFLYFRLSPADDSAPENAYFYDLDERKLFVAPRKSIPPIPGIKGKADVGVRAVVISTTGNPKDSGSQQIAYLEKYSPEMKGLLDEAQKARAEGRRPAAPVDRSLAPGNTLVRRLNDSEWFPLASPEGERIASDWNQPGPDGRSPVIISP